LSAASFRRLITDRQFEEAAGRRIIEWPVLALGE
jgi:hypothetical protein